jgi:hypothetical protein
MANTHCVNVGYRPDELVSIDFYEDGRDHLLHLHVLFHNTIEGVRNEVHDHVQVHFIWFFTICVEELPHLDTVRVMKSFQDLKFTVLISLVLENLLDSYGFPSFSNGGLENDTKGPVAYDLLCIIGQTLFIV